ncbi:MAG: hypothetical protein HYZ07_02620 [Candidatus Harrisonbacteria bacterium]|nr:hypothetical protein [Candidatus Harrisonbacteria bacterium]MBI2406072.1 hypothetical protein [Candidatus Harrisonbacteria bacterium]MBI2604438.1 hypothetical protein [Candidatus Harrisonbacteria bacterium]MBI3114831.1 hypothetical protein [Candidatus Harrisonbacteria bacterium]
MANGENLGPWVEEVTADAVELLKERGKIPGYIRGADGQGIDFLTGIDFIIGLRNGLSMKLQVKYSERRKPFRTLSKHLRRYGSVRYILLFSNVLEDDLVKWELEQKGADVKDRFNRCIPDGIHIALIRTDAEIHALAARERKRRMANRRYRELSGELHSYQWCRANGSRRLPKELWKILADKEEEVRRIVKAEREPLKANPRYRAYVEKVAAAIAEFVEAACITALNYEKEEEIRRNGKT